MEMTVRMPANYNLMTEDEMTYTNGGAAGDVAAVVAWGVGVAATVAWYWNWIDQLLGARRWYAANQTGNIGTDLEKGFDTWLNYTTSSVSNCIRSVLATTQSIGSPIGWVGSAVAFLTV